MLCEKAEPIPMFTDQALVVFVSALPSNTAVSNMNQSFMKLSSFWLGSTVFKVDTSMSSFQFCLCFSEEIFQVVDLLDPRSSQQDSFCYF